MNRDDGFVELNRFAVEQSRPVEDTCQRAIAEPKLVAYKNLEGSRLKRQRGL